MVSLFSRKLSNTSQFLILLSTAELRDNSGMRFIYTPHLRQYDAGAMRQGAIVGGNFLVVPPQLEAFEIGGGCPASCLSKVSYSIQ